MTPDEPVVGERDRLAVQKFVGKVFSDTLTHESVTAMFATVRAEGYAAGFADARERGYEVARAIFETCPEHGLAWGATLQIANEVRALTPEKER